MFKIPIKCEKKKLNNKCLNLEHTFSELFIKSLIDTLISPNTCVLTSIYISITISSIKEVFLPFPFNSDYPE